MCYSHLLDTTSLPHIFSQWIWFHTLSFWLLCEVWMLLYNYGWKVPIITWDEWLSLFFLLLLPKCVSCYYQLQHLLCVNKMKNKWLIQTSNLCVYLLLKSNFLVLAQLNFGHFSGFVYEYCERVQISISSKHFFVFG